MLLKEELLMFLEISLCQAVTDEAKKKLARTKFGNPVDSDPTNCLTFHGFKSRQSQAAPESFSIRNGQRLALAGAKRKSPAPSSPSLPLKVVKLLDLSQVMQSKCAEFLVLRRGPGSLKALKEKRLEVPDQLLKEFLTSLTRLKQAVLENENFLHYYSNRQASTSYSPLSNFTLLIVFVERVPL